MTVLQSSVKWIMTAMQDVCACLGCVNVTRQACVLASTNQSVDQMVYSTHRTVSCTELRALTAFTSEQTEGASVLRKIFKRKVNLAGQT